MTSYPVMASEPGENAGTEIAVPAELSEWLDEQAGVLEVDRTELLTQILASYRATAELDETGDQPPVAELSAAEIVDVDEVVQQAVDDAVDEAATAAATATIEERVPALVQSTVDDALDEAVEDRLASVETEFQSKITDVRERVIQVKRETDAKASADHTHEELERMESLEDKLESLRSELDSLAATLAERTEALEDVTDDVDGLDEELTSATEELADVSSKLNRVAWVVSDLKDDVKSQDRNATALNRIKRAAAKEGLSTVSCENCNDTVDVSLMTEPECPHCNATVSDVRPAGGIFRSKGRLVTAAQLEAGPDDEEQ
jgi:chromosome segregation ATPase